LSNAVQFLSPQASLGMGGAEDKHAPMQFGSSFRAKNILQSERYFMLDQQEGYAECRQHWGKIVDFDGNMCPPGPPTSMPFISAMPAPFQVPLRQRRPLAPMRLAKLVVQSFTALLFGEDRWPELNLPGDEAGTDYIEALIEAQSLPARMVQARNYGGSCGTVGLSWAFTNGKPRVEVHRGKHLFVHEWRDRAELIPKAISEVYTYPNPEWDPEKQAFVTAWYWFHRYWDEQQDIVFKAWPFKSKEEPQWIPDVVTEHNDGEAHFVWVQNLPNDEIDGLSDYDGQLENFDDLDVLWSVLTRGTTLNLDPTLVLKTDPARMMVAGQVKKGSDHSLNVGEAGDAKYLELAGTAAQAGLAVVKAKRDSILEIAQCIVADPNELAAQGISSVALKVIFAPMTSKTNILREQYGTAIKRLILQQLRVVRTRAEQEVLLLPDRIEDTGEVDGDGKAITNAIPREPGDSEDLKHKWPEYFPATPDDQSKAVTSMTTATGGKSILSKQTACEEVAKSLGRDPDEEWKRLQDQQQQDLEAAAKAYEDANEGGQVNVEKALEDESTITFSGSDGPPAKGGGGGGGGFGGMEGGAPGGQPKPGEPGKPPEGGGKPF
jgi:hypothetical protein